MHLYGNVLAQSLACTNNLSMAYLGESLFEKVCITVKWLLNSEKGFYRREMVMKSWPRWREGSRREECTNFCSFEKFEGKNNCFADKFETSYE